MLRRLEIAFPVFWCWIAVGFMPSAFAETVELVTYYPAPGGADTDTNRLHARAATIGPPYSLTNPATLTDGTLLVADAIGIGPGFTATPPAGALHVVGTDDALDRVLFMPGADTGAAGAPDIRVGIGTAAPARRLHVFVPVNPNPGIGDGIQIAGVAPGLWLVDQTSPTEGINTQRGGFGLAKIADNYGVGTQPGDVSLFSQTGKLHFATTPTNANPNVRMTVDTAGNVGIGVTNPGVKLDVAQNNAIRVGDTYVSSGIGGSTLWAHFGLNCWYSGAANSDWVFTNPNSRISLMQLMDDSISFYTNANSTNAGWVNRLHIAPTGNVGIGTTNPAYPLQVSRDYTGGGPNPNPQLLISGSNPDQQLQLGYHTGGNYALIQSIQQGVAFRTLSLQPFGGNVGIGINDPAYKLHVNGSICYSGSPCASDARFKANVRPIAGALEKLERIHGVSFEWSHLGETVGQPAGKKDVGLVAQEVEKVFPELVSQWGEQHYRAVDYNRLTAVLVEAVKEQQRQIEDLKREVEGLRD